MEVLGYQTEIIRKAQGRFSSLKADLCWISLGPSTPMHPYEEPGIGLYSEGLTSELTYLGSYCSRSVLKAANISREGPTTLVNKATTKWHNLTRCHLFSKAGTPSNLGMTGIVPLSTKKECKTLSHGIYHTHSSIFLIYYIILMTFKRCESLQEPIFSECWGYHQLVMIFKWLSSPQIYP